MNNQNYGPGEIMYELKRYHRRRVLGLLGLGLLTPLSACSEGRKKMHDHIILDVEMFSYFDRPVGFINFNGTDLGVMNNYGGTGTITGVRIPFGAQTLTWSLDGPPGTPDNGKKVSIKNKLMITPNQIPPDTRYLGLHLYPDNTVEITFSEFIPEVSERGKRILTARK